MVGGHLSGDVLLDDSHNQFPECHIVADDRRLDDPYCLVVAFLNAGNQPLLRSEFDCPLRISYPGSEFIGYAIRSSRARLPLEVNVLGKSDLEIEPLLLNPGEGFALSILLDGRPTDVQIDPRVASTRLGPTEAEPVSLALLAALGQRLPVDPKGSAGSRLGRAGRSVVRRFRRG
jgi:hypothetical protein